MLLGQKIKWVPKMGHIDPGGYQNGLAKASRSSI